MSSHDNNTPSENTNAQQRSEPAGAQPAAVTSPKRAASRQVVVAMLCMGLTGALTLLFWKKLQLVTGVPRTAYAEPEQKREGEKTGANREEASVQGEQVEPR